ncbi:MAG: glutamine--fructose-6-phosphate transaminase (isomerizing) [Elusimicrobia bacterium]|nr:glutamine--fructose-6-phosphate transaminase (isomerizing) [Elusimicrobiota bacterium]MBD3412226.1 glutamine--fructose-6-phosphate transaminase (isomerizing) [Elusimicrobiota bacterium]
MCGIVGYIGQANAAAVLLDGLRRLEYRGYDSSGIAAIHENRIEVRRAVGKLDRLEKRMNAHSLQGCTGIGHTRWATHGKPSEENAHPHTCCKKKIVVVHNGIIENYAELKKQLIDQGHRFESQTDTEVIAHLIERHFTGSLRNAVIEALRHVVGAYALGVICADDPEHIIAARNDCPLVIGIGEKEYFMASDVPAILHRTRDVIFLDNGEIAELSRNGYAILTLDGNPVEKKPVRITWNAIQAEKSGYRHFMLKEIFEQPDTIRDTLRGRIIPGKSDINIEELNLDPSLLSRISRLHIVACGTSYHAAMVGKFLFEEVADCPCEVDIASEFRYRKLPLNDQTLFLTISQSGETADTLAALREAKRKGCTTISICNVLGSSLARESHGVLFTHCGPEIGVASTKAFTGQLTALYILVLYAGRMRAKISEDQLQSFIQSLTYASHAAQRVLDQEPEIRKLARKYYKRSDFLFLGRHLNFPIALEGALKLKEISYIHAEGYPAGEMKHGPIALIDEKMPVVAIATQSSIYEKIASNIEEAKARGGIIIALGTEGNTLLKNIADQVIYVPAIHELFYPIISVIPLQLLAYHIAVLRGCDVDQPRNLAKSVTVE